MYREIFPHFPFPFFAPGVPGEQKWNPISLLLPLSLWHWLSCCISWCWQVAFGQVHLQVLSVFTTCPALRLWLCFLTISIWHIWRYTSVIAVEFQYDAHIIHSSNHTPWYLGWTHVWQQLSYIFWIMLVSALQAKFCRQTSFSLHTRISIQEVCSKNDTPFSHFEPGLSRVPHKWLQSFWPNRRCTEQSVACVCSSRAGSELLLFSWTLNSVA